MIVFDLSCSQNHRFEGWFGSSADYESQRERGLLSCPHCGCDQIGKAPMAPAVPAKGKATGGEGESVRAEPVQAEGQAVIGGGAGGAVPGRLVEAMRALAEVQAEALKQSKWVGEDFAERSRAMHYGEQEEEVIHGRATADEARELHEEGIAVAPLLVPVTPPDELN